MRNIIRVITTLALLISFNFSYAQSLKWDSTYRPGKYKELVAKFAAEAKSKKDVIFLGNSITAGGDIQPVLRIDS